VKIRILGRITRGSDGVFRFPYFRGKGSNAKALHFDLDASYQPDSPEPTQPLGKEFSYMESVWAYRGTAFAVTGGSELSLEEIGLKIKHAARD
jgi:hypothetical protein